MPNTTMKFYRRDVIKKLVKKYGEKQKFTEEEKGLFLAYDKKSKTWTACDNSDGSCWVEDFKSRRDAIKWLFGI